MSDQAWKDETAATIERLTKERDHYLSNWKDARRYLTIEIGHAEDAEERADSLAAELAKVTKERDALAIEAGQAWDKCEERRLEGHAYFMELAKAREALMKIAETGGDYTTGDGHARCKEIARAACPWEESEPDPDQLMEQRREDRETEARTPRDWDD